MPAVNAALPAVTVSFLPMTAQAKVKRECVLLLTVLQRQVLERVCFRGVIRASMRETNACLTTGRAAGARNQLEGDTENRLSGKEPVFVQAGFSMGHRACRRPPIRQASAPRKPACSGRPCIVSKAGPVPAPACGPGVRVLPPGAWTGLLRRSFEFPDQPRADEKATGKPDKQKEHVTQHCVFAFLQPGWRV